MHYHKYADDTQLYTSLTIPAFLEPRPPCTLYVRAATLVLGKWSTAEPDQVRGAIVWN